MVLEFIKYNSVFSFLLGTLLFTVSCQSEVLEGGKQLNLENGDQLKVTDTCMVNGVLFELLYNPVSDKAALRMSSEKVVQQGKIQLSPPCYFLRRNKKLQMYSYPEVDIEKTLIILGDTVGADKKRYFGFKESDDFSRICGMGTQGILVKKDSVIITHKVLTGGFTCTDPGTDEKDFWDFAHNR
jgi:hypothetical protein